MLAGVRLCLYLNEVFENEFLFIELFCVLVVEVLYFGKGRIALDIFVFEVLFKFLEIFQVPFHLALVHVVQAQHNSAVVIPGQIEALDLYGNFVQLDQRIPVLHSKIFYFFVL